ncbi:hypothetical protein B0J17DRAFT_58552 [Rhizoctonia solani]|nr:hypothetical protein B0J17DRAFT_58552 [Rhizoctonia solani]
MTRTPKNKGKEPARGFTPDREVLMYRPKTAWGEFVASVWHAGWEDKRLKRPREDDDEQLPSRAVTRRPPRPSIRGSSGRSAPKKPAPPPGSRSNRVDPKPPRSRRRLRPPTPVGLHPPPLSLQELSPEPPASYRPSPVPLVSYVSSPSLGGTPLPVPAPGAFEYPIYFSSDNELSGAEDKDTDTVSVVDDGNDPESRRASSVSPAPSAASPRRSPSPERPRAGPSARIPSTPPPPYSEFPEL